MTVPQRLAIGVGAVLLLGVSACSSSSTNGVVVSVARPADVHISPAVSSVARPTVDVAVVPDRRGTVIAVAVHNGQHVRRGERLASIRTVGSPQQVDALNNRIQGDYAALTLARSRYGKNSAQAQAALRAIVSDRKALARIKAVSGTLTAPAAGTVTGLAVTAGSPFDSSTVMMRVINPAQARFTAIFAPEYDFFLHAGTRVVVRRAADARTFARATISSVTPTTASDGDRACDIVVDNRSGRFPADDPVTVSVALDRRAAVTVDNLAVLQADQSPTVFVVHSGHVVQRAVRVGLADLRSTEILAGVATGDRVVIAGAQGLKSGAEVTVTRTEAAP